MAFFNFGRTMTKKEYKHLNIGYFIYLVAIFGARIILLFAGVKGPTIEPMINTVYCILLGLLVSYYLIRTIPEIIIIRKKYKFLKKELNSITKKIDGMNGGHVQEHEIENQSTTKIETYRRNNDLLK